MDKTSNSENPLAELIQLFGKDGMAHKDINDLKSSLDSLTKTLEKRAGKSKKEQEDSEKPSRTLIGDIKDFGKGFASPFTKDLPQYLGFGKSSLPENISKVTSETEEPQQIEPMLQAPNENPVVENKLGDIGNIVPREESVQDIPKELPREIATPMPEIQAKEISAPLTAVAPPHVSSDSTNKVLSDMVEVLIDLKDDKTQKQILEEAINIKKIISENIVSPSDKSKGVEPNNESAKSEDREKLAEAIADKLSDVLSSLSGGINIPEIPGGKAGKAAATASVLSSVAVPAAVGVGGLALAAGATNAISNASNEQLDMLSNSGAGDDTGMAAAIIRQSRDNEDRKPNTEAAPKENKSKVEAIQDPNPDEARYILQKGTQEEIKNWGGEEKLKDIIKKSETITPSNKTLKLPDQAKEMVSPKESPALKNVLQNVTDTNTDLKLSPQTTQTNTIAPIVSNKVVNNTEQTIIGSSPTPHSSYSSFNRWQDKRAAYTDR
jgi:hypothetical protein